MIILMCIKDFYVPLMFEGFDQVSNEVIYTSRKGTCPYIQSVFTG